MLRQSAKMVGRTVVARAMHEGARTGGADGKRGLALLRDPRVPLRAKAVALLSGLGFLGVLNVLELPVESAVALAMPVVGWPPLLVWNGIELIVVPLAVASLLLSRAVARAERAATRTPVPSS